MRIGSYGIGHMNDIREVLNELGIPFVEAGSDRHVSGDGYVGIQCPYCSPNSGKYKLGIPPYATYCHCWGCGWKSLKEVLIESCQSPNTVFKLLKDFRSNFIPPNQNRSADKPIGVLKKPPGVIPMLPIHKKYLKGRGFNPEELASIWGIKGIGAAIKLAWRIYIPIILNGKQISWTTRKLSNEGQRYHGAKSHEEAFPAKQILFGSDYVGHSILVHEGPFDVFRIGPGAVGTLGIDFTKSQAKRIAKYPTRTICFDSSPDAQKRAKELADVLTCFPGRTNIVEIDAADPAEMKPREVQLLRRSFLK